MLRSLNLRLIVYAGITIALALAAAWAILSLLFERHATSQLQASLENQGLSLIAGLSLQPNGRPALATPLPDPRFHRPASGLYWRITAPAGDIRSRSLWDGAVNQHNPPPASGWGVEETTGPFEPHILLVTRAVQLDPGSPRITVQVASDLSPVFAAQSRFSNELALYLGILWIALTLASWMQVRLGLRPFGRLRAELGAMQRNPAARFQPAQQLREVEPLTDAINALADSRADDVARARHRARDLAHALKTPITALRLQIDSLDNAAKQQHMMQSLSLLSRAIEGELARTGTAPTHGSVAARAIIDRLIAVIARTPDGQRIALINAITGDLTIPLNEDAALETLGAILENAARHAATRVTATGRTEAGMVWLTIDDDGPGIPAHLRATVLDRGVRLDQRSAQHGLGLAIATDYVSTSGGTLELAEAPGGGLRVRLSWPLT